MLVYNLAFISLNIVFKSEYTFQETMCLGRWRGGISKVDNIKLLKACFLVCERTWKNTPEIHFIYFGNEEIYCILEMCIISVLLSEK
jgi:hypothetical protein